MLIALEAEVGTIILKKIKKYLKVTIIKEKSSL